MEQSLRDRSTNRKQGKGERILWGEMDTTGEPGVKRPRCYQWSLLGDCRHRVPEPITEGIRLQILSGSPYGAGPNVESPISAPAGRGARRQFFQPIGGPV